MGFASGLYDGAASVGRAMSWVRLVIALIVACIMCIVASVLYRLGAKFTGSANATVDSADCGAVTVEDPGTGGGRSNAPPTTHVEQRCALAVHYVAGGKTVRANMTRQSRDATFKAGDKFDVAYDPSAPGTPVEKGAPAGLKYGASALCSCAICVVVLAVLYFALIQNSKLAAAGNGAGTVFGLFRD
jgi:hypothetical protein